MTYKAFFCGEYDHTFTDEDDERMDFMRQELGRSDYDGIWEFETESGETVLPQDLCDDAYTSCTNGDYGPGNPWDAPGMTIQDFI